jgi:hypothetical protein
MSIDTFNEKLVSLTQAAKLLPHRRKGKRPDVATLYRWTTGGCRGIVLESIQVGGTRCTSREALQRFFTALTARAMDAPKSPTRAAPKPARHSPRRAEEILDEAGIK